MAKKTTKKSPAPAPVNAPEQKLGESPERYRSDVPPDKRNKVGYSNEL